MDENKKAHPVTAKIPSCIEASVPQFLYDRISAGCETLPDGTNIPGGTAQLQRELKSKQRGIVVFHC